MKTRYFKKYFTHNGTRSLLIHGLGAVHPPHSIDDIDFFNELKHDMMKNGWNGRPLLGHMIGRDIYLWTGSHRSAAAFSSKVPIPVFIIDLNDLESVNAITMSLSKNGGEDLEFIDSRNELAGYDGSFFDDRLIPVLETMGENDIAKIAAREHDLEQNLRH